MRIIKELFLFGLAGTLGFLIDAGILYLLKPFLGLYVGRCISFLCAVIFTWLFNRLYTFSGEKRERKILSEFMSYFVLMLMGGVFNVSIYSLLIGQSEMVRTYPVIGVAVGSIVGMLVNFSTSRLMFYSQKS